MPQLSGSLAPLRHTNFRWYFLAGAVNTAGSTMAGVALAFAVLSIAGPSELGVVLAAMTVPLVLFLLVGGVLADRLPVTLVLRAGMVVNGVTQLAVAILVITGTAQIWMLVCLEAVNGTSLAMAFPALASVLPRLVPRELLQQANGLQSVVRGTFRILGPTISALLVVGVGPGWALAVDGATWLVAATMLLLVRIPPPPPIEDRPSTFTQLHEGWQYVRSTPWLWSVSLAFCFLNAIQSGAWNTLGPAEAKLTIGAKGWGYVLSAQSVGLLLMTFVLLRRRVDRPLRSGMVGIAMLGLPMLGLGLSPHLPVLIVIGFLAGLGNEVFTIGWALAMQEHVPEDMLSRAYSYDALGSFAAMPVGQLAFGPLGVALGLRPVIAVAGAAYVVIALLPLTSRTLRDLRRVPVEEPAPTLS